MNKILLAMILILASETSIAGPGLPIFIGRGEINPQQTLTFNLDKFSMQRGDAYQINCSLTVSQNLKLLSALDQSYVNYFPASLNGNPIGNLGIHRVQSPLKAGDHMFSVTVKSTKGMQLVFTNLGDSGVVKVNFCEALNDEWF